MKTISLFSGYIYLIIGVILGIASNGFLKTTESFTKITPTIFCIISIVACIFCLSRQTKYTCNYANDTKYSWRNFCETFSSFKKSIRGYT